MVIAVLEIALLLLVAGWSVVWVNDNNGELRQCGQWWKLPAFITYC
jgi:hypothetical protein